MSGLRIEVVRSPEGLDELRDDWSALLDRAAEDSVFLSYEWIRSWWEAFGEGTGASLYLLAVWAGDELVGIVPLLRDRRRVLGRRRVGIFFCANNHSNRINLVIAQDCLAECITAIVEHLLRHQRDWDVVQLEPMIRNSPVTEALLAALHHAGVRYGMSTCYCSPFLTLPSSWGVVVDNLSTSFRKTLRRKINKAKKLRTVGIDETAIPARVDDAMAIDRHTWQYANGTGISSRGPNKTFYTTLAHRMAGAGWLRLVFVTLDAKPVCFEYNLLYKNVLYNLKLGYLPEQGHWSPGLFLKHHVLSQMASAGVSEYDFLGLDEPYKLHWTSTVRPHCFVCLVGSTWDVRLAAFVQFRFRPWLTERLPALKRAKEFVTRGRLGRS